MKYLICATAILFSVYSDATTKEDVGNKASEAAAAAVSYTQEQKEEFQKSMEQKLEELNTQISDLKEASAKKGTQARKETQKTIAALEAKKETMKKDLAQLKTRTGKAWGEMKSGMSQAWDSLKESYDKAKSEMSSQE